jgi:transposase-like protein
MGYTKELKAAMIQKILLNPDRPMTSFAKEANIPTSTVATWLSNYKKRNGILVNSKKKNWSAEQKFQAVLETASLNEAEKNEYCRKHGIYQAQLKEWKKDCIAGCRKSPDKDFIKKSKQTEQQLKRKTKNLEKELVRKDKALAEAAALLVLKKKVQELWEDPEEE